MSISGVVPAIRPHKDAPLFSSLLSSSSPLSSASGSIAPEPESPLFNDLLSSPPTLDVVRQASLVSLHFFLKAVAAMSGPYNKTNDDLHLDMCNFRQSDACMADGARGAALIPRGHSKSTFFTHGAILWEIIRNPDIRICIVNNVEHVAKDFMRIVRLQFESNALLKALWPELCPKSVGAQPRWNENEFVSPARSRTMKEPTVMALGVGAAAEGSHFDLIVIDDPDGLDSLDSSYMANANMEQTKKWFRTNSYALLDSWVTSRILFVGTRYAVDDTASIISNDCREVVGYQGHDFTVKPEGTWSIYYRKALEDGTVIYPEKFSKKEFEAMAANPDTHWTWMTQYENSPRNSGLTEFNRFTIQECRLEYDSERFEYVIIVGDDDVVPLSLCDVVMAIDPAATDKGVTAKTSRSSIGVSAMDWNGRVFRIWSRVGFFRIDEIFDHIFVGHQYFRGRIRVTVFENNAFQKVLGPLLRDEEERRGIYINPQGKPATSDKVARIRSTLGAFLAKRRLYATDEAGLELRDELRGFPMSDRMDALDEQEKACTVLSKPDEPRLVARRFAEDEEREYAPITNCVGY